ncbi:MAG: hypothetical protein U9R08_01010 [Nanoarchaeota archaeon]|nr:hypothetical protein [Nanoarchaeota archaeon]
MLDTKIRGHIEGLIKSYENNPIKIVGDIDFNLGEKISQITHYVLSKYTDGGKDEDGNTYRFRNVGNALVDLE